jgi:PAS domain S-box-containing protein
VFLSKPIDETELVARINAMLQIKRAEDTLREEKLRKYRDHLEVLVEECTAELTKANIQLQQEIAERKRTEEALRESEEKFKLLSEESPNMIFINVMGKIVYANRKCAEMMGYTREEFYAPNFDFLRLIAPESIEVIQSNFIKHRQGVELEPYEYTLLTKDHKRINSIITTKLITYETKKAILGIVTDITERKRAEEQLRLSEERYALAQRIAHIGSWDWNIQTGALHWSDQIEPLFGFDRGEFAATYQAFLDCVHPEDRQYVIDSVNATIEKDKDYAIEHRIVWPDGTVHWVSETGDVIRDEHGKAIRMLGIVQDITNRKRAEEALQHARKEWQDIFEAIGQPTVILDTQYTVIAANRAVLQATGKSEDELKRMKCYEIFHEQGTTRPPKGCPLEKILVSGRLEMVEMEMDILGGTYLVSYTPVTDETGQLTKVIHIATNITDRKHTEEELQKAKEAAETANRAKSEFLAHMSHEIRTPLNGILGYAQILKRDPSLTEKHQEAIDVIQRSGNHLLTLINDILDLSKIEAGKLDIAHTDFHFRHFLENLADMVRIWTEQKGIALMCQFAPNLPTGVKGDEKRLRQVLLNLLGNAVKFTETGGVTFRVEARSNRFSEIDRKSAKVLTTDVRFQVEDTGIGIPPEKIDEIFKPFEQVRDRQVKSEGTGLGLAISQRLVEMMGGQLHVQSTVDEGSTFWFDVDLPKIEHVVVDTTEPFLNIIGYKDNACKILLVDDQAENLSMLEEMLLPLGFDIIEAMNGTDAVNKAIECIPDLILMDLVMPGIDGFEATKQIRQIPELNESIIIAVSASTYDHTKKDCLAIGCNDFIEKPVSIDDLLEKMQVHLKLEWIYEGERETQETKSALQEAQVISPPQEELAVLFEFAKIGDILNIKKRIDHLEQLDKTFLPFARKIRQLAKGFEMNAIKTLIRQYMEEKHD